MRLDLRRAAPASTPYPSRPHDSPRLAVVGGVLAALVMGVGMLVLRSTLGVRTIPERVMEWLLLFVPTRVFEAALRVLGFDAKRYGLDAAVIIILAAFAALGYAVLKRRWPIPALAALGLGVWLFIMLVILPLTSAGLFGTALLEGTAAIILGYLAVSLSYSAVLVVARAWADARVEPEALPLRDRRTLLAAVGAAAAAYAATFVGALLAPAGGRAPSIMLVDPQEPVPSGGLDPPNPHPQAVTSPVAQAAQAAAPTAAPVAAAATPGLPEPPPPRELQRDKDGAVLPSGRTPGQLAPAVTSNADFYVVTKNAGGDPVLHPDNWRLLVDGDVQRSFELDYATLRRLPAVEVTKTLECISNLVGKPELAPFGAELISTARWKGVPVRDILALTGGPKQDARWLAVLSADEYTSALPMDVVNDPATLLVYEMNGAVLPREHGYPARVLVPGHYGMKSPKWVVGLRPMTREFLDWYGQRNWSKEGVVHTMTRIDSPTPDAPLQAGANTISGIAYAGSRGVARVEYSADGGKTWTDAEFLEAASGPDTWVRWRGSFTVQPGSPITLVARATDGTGALQDEAFTLPEPDGGTGWPHVQVG